MIRIKTSAALLALGLATTACGIDTHNGPITHVSNPSLYSLNEPVVQRTDYVLDLAAAGGLPENEWARLDNWFQSLQLSYGDRVFVDASYADPAAREDVARIAERYGVLLTEGTPITAGSPQSGSVRVIVSRAIASVPGCPIWEDPQIGQSSRTSTNYGCALNSNLAQMIADPNDLVLGQEGGIDGAANTGMKAVKAYRDKAATAGVAATQGTK